jgi:ribonuclease HII
MATDTNTERSNNYLVLGIDDAGRGPLIGPMFLSGVLLDKNSETFLKNHNITDSKLLSHTTRIQLAKTIKGSVLNYKTLSSSPEEIDKAINSKLNLNTLEAIKSAQIINELNPLDKKVKVVIDCPSTNTQAWKNTVLSYVKHPENLSVFSEHKADLNHLSVSAASILAKVAREESVSTLKEKYGNLGSGYPSDPTTKTFLKEQGLSLANEGIFRKSWATWKKLFPEKEQGTLDNF